VKLLIIDDEPHIGQRRRAAAEGGVRRVGICSVRSGSPFPCDSVVKNLGVSVSRWQPVNTIAA